MDKKVEIKVVRNIWQSSGKIVGRKESTPFRLFGGRRFTSVISR